MGPISVWEDEVLEMSSGDEHGVFWNASRPLNHALINMTMLNFSYEYFTTNKRIVLISIEQVILN